MLVLHAIEVRDILGWKSGCCNSRWRSTVYAQPVADNCCCCESWVLVLLYKMILTVSLAEAFAGF